MTVLTFSAINGKKPTTTTLSSTAANNSQSPTDKLPLVSSGGDIESNGTDGYAPGESKKSPLIVTMLMRSRAQRISSMTTVCVFLTALLVFTTGIVGGYYLYRQFSQYKLRHYRGWCSIPYDRAELIDSSTNQASSYLSFRRFFPSFTSTAAPALIAQNRLRTQIDQYMDEEFDIDLEFEEFERIEVPNFDLGGRARFVHDFNSNLTGIVDLDNLRCFVLPLNRSLVIPPRDLVDMIMKIQTGYYNMDTSVIRESYRVITPAITNYKSIGYYISRECGDMATYRLEKIKTVTEVFKRSIEKGDSRPIFSEFAGRNIVEFHIDASNAPGKRSGHQ